MFHVRNNGVFVCWFHTRSSQSPNTLLEKLIYFPTDQSYAAVKTALNALVSTIALLHISQSETSPSETKFYL